MMAVFDRHDQSQRCQQPHEARPVFPMLSRWRCFFSARVILSSFQRCHGSRETPPKSVLQSCGPPPQKPLYSITVLRCEGNTDIRLYPHVALNFRGPMDPTNTRNVRGRDAPSGIVAPSDKWLFLSSRTTALPPRLFRFSHGLLPDCCDCCRRVIGCVRPAQEVQSTANQGDTGARKPVLDIWCVVGYRGSVGTLSLTTGKGHQWYFQSEEAGDIERRFFETYGNIVRWKGPLGVSAISNVDARSEVFTVSTL